MEHDASIADASHIANIGRLVEEMENKIRNTLNEIYLGKTRDIVNGLRSVIPLADERQTNALRKDLAAALQRRQAKVDPPTNWIRYSPLFFLLSLFQYFAWNATFFESFHCRWRLYKKCRCYYVFACFRLQLNSWERPIFAAAFLFVRAAILTESNASRWLACVTSEMHRRVNFATLKTMKRQLTT